MLIYDRCKLVSEFIVASTWFTLHGVPPRLTQGDWHEISIPYTHHHMFLAPSSPVVTSLVTYTKRCGKFPAFTTVQIATGLFSCFGVNFGVRSASSSSDGRRLDWPGWRMVFCVLKRSCWGMYWWFSRKWL